MISGVPKVQVPSDAPVGDGLVVVIEFSYNIDLPEERPPCVRGVLQAGDH